jgi:ABC-type multidrug transport system ATPase subunit
VIVTRALTKRYGRVLAVDRVDLDVREGDRYGFLGPNGSGKTTVVRMLLGLVYATSGEIEVMGKPVPARVSDVLPHIGALVEGPGNYGHLSGRANLALLDASGRTGSRRTRRRRISNALDRVGLGGIDSRPVKKYSLGMRQRLGLAAALLRSPRLLILDEPTNGLDPQGIREVRDLLAELNAGGATVFMSSHQLSEVEQLCTRVGIVDHGRLVLQQDLDELRAPTGRVLVRTPDADRAAALLDGHIEKREGDQLAVAEADPAEVNAVLVRAGLRVTEISAERRSLEQQMLAVTSSGSDRIDRPERPASKAGTYSDRPGKPKPSPGAAGEVSDRAGGAEPSPGAAGEVSDRAGGAEPSPGAAVTVADTTVRAERPPGGAGTGAVVPESADDGQGERP